MTTRRAPGRRFGYRRGPQPSSEWRGSILAANLEYAGKPKPTNYQLGRRAEQAARRVLAREGYRTTLTPFSSGAADVWAVAKDGTEGPPARLVQVKRNTDPSPSWANEALLKLRQCGVSATTALEVWLHIGDSRAFVVRVVQLHGVVTVTGRDPWATKTRVALAEAMLL